VRAVYFFLMAAAAVYGVLRSILAMANTQFGAITIADGYASPPALLPNNNEVFTYFVGGAQTTGTEKQGFLMSQAGTIVDVRAYLTTAPTGQSFIVDLMKNGVTMFTTSGNRPTIAASGNASTTTLPDIVSVAVGDRLRIDNIQVGSGVAGSNLYVTVTLKVANVA
jgi:hypothetical protein